MKKEPGRTITTVAVGFLLLDGVLLAIAGVWGKRIALLLGAVACAVMSPHTSSTAAPAKSRRRTLAR